MVPEATEADFTVAEPCKTVDGPYCEQHLTGKPVTSAGLADIFHHINQGQRNTASEIEIQTACR